MLENVHPILFENLSERYDTNFMMTKRKRICKKKSILPLSVQISTYNHKSSSILSYLSLLVSRLSLKKGLEI